MSLTAFQITSTRQDNFVYDLIEDGNTVTIPVNQQMMVYELLDIYGDGEILIDGTLLMLDS